MDRLVSKALQNNYRKLAKQFFSQRGCRRFFKWNKRTVGHRSSETLLSQITEINPLLGNTCQKCLARQISGLLPTQVANVIQKQIQAVSCLFLQSKQLLSSPASITEGNLHLFSPSSRLGQKKEDSEASNGRKGGEQGQPDDNDEEDEARRKAEIARSYFYTLFGMVLLAWIISLWEKGQDTSSAYISWSEFYHNLLLKGEVKSVHLFFSNKEDGEDIAVIQTHDGAVVKGATTSKARYIIKIPKGLNFEERVRQTEDELGMPLKERIPITYGYPNSWAMVVTQVMFIGILLFFLRQMYTFFTKSKDGNVTDLIDVLSGGIRQAKFTRVDVVSKGSKAVSFKDVAGLKEAKIEVMEFVDYLTKPERFKTLGAKTPRGALLLGPPGCGKTLLARALATEAKVPFLAMAGSEFVEMIGGVGAARVRSLFKEARNKAPCIIYIDEIDAIGRSRGGSASGRGEDEHTLNQLLVEMDGIGTQEGVILLAATNRADILDKALLRPGRFDRHIMIDLPTLAEREEIFLVYLNNLKLAQPGSAYAKALSRLTPGMSGADISNICNEAAIHAARDLHKTVDNKDFEYAVERVIAGVEKKSNLLSPTEKKVVAYHESGHALVGWMLKYTDALLRISIVPRTNSALGFAQYLPSDQKLYSQEELFERMCMALGGRAAESLIFNHVSSGAHDDLQRVTKMAYDQIRSFGMNARIGYLSFPGDDESTGGTKPYSQKLASAIDEEARMLVAKAFFHTQTVLQEHKDKLHKLAMTLLEKEVLNYEEIQTLIGPPIHGKKHIIEAQGWEGIMPSSEKSV